MMKHQCNHPLKWTVLCNAIAHKMIVTIFKLRNIHLSIATAKATTTTENGLHYDMMNTLHRVAQWLDVSWWNNVCISNKNLSKMNKTHLMNRYEKYDRDYLNFLFVFHSSRNYLRRWQLKLFISSHWGSKEWSKRSTDFVVKRTDLVHLVFG